MSATVLIRPLTSADAEQCDAIVRSLPYHFGDESGRLACARAVREDDGLVAAIDGEVVGFLTVELNFTESAEITWMAVRNDQRRRGIGRALVAQLVDELQARDRTLLLVLTLGPSADEGQAEDTYERTRAFYRSAGFRDAREWPDFWPNNPALLMVRVLDPTRLPGDARPIPE